MELDEIFNYFPTINVGRLFSVFFLFRCKVFQVRNKCAFAMSPGFLFFLNVLGIVASYTGEVTILHQPSNCASDEYFNVNQLRCVTCDMDKNLMRSEDGTSRQLFFRGEFFFLDSVKFFEIFFAGLSCVCNEKSKIKKWTLASYPLCELCKDNEIPTSDQLECVACPQESLIVQDNFTFCERFDCPKNSIRRKLKIYNY